MEIPKSTVPQPLSSYSNFVNFSKQGAAKKVMIALTPITSSSTLVSSSMPPAPVKTEKIVNSVTKDSSPSKSSPS